MTHDTTTHVHDADPPKVKSRKGCPSVRWTQEEIKQLHLLYNRGVKRYEIAKKLGMPEDRIRQRLQWESKAGTILTARKRRRAAQRLVTKEEQKSARVFFERVEPHTRPPDEAIAERDQRFLAPARTLAGFVFGDPPTGFSALDRRA
jgi:hypothetical protein